MAKLLLTTLFLLSSLAICLSSCKAPESNSPDHTTTMVDSLVNIYKQQLFNDPVITKQQVINQLKNSKDSITYYRMMEVLGLCYMFNNQTDSALITDKAIIRFTQTTTAPSPLVPELGAIACHAASQFLHNAGQKDSSLVYLNRGLQILRATNYQEPKRHIPSFYLTMADTYLNMCNYPQAVSNCRKALQAADSLGLSDKMDAAIYGTLARIYLELKNYPLADEYFQLIEENFTTMKPYDQYYFCNTRGYFYYNQKKYSEALPWYQRADSCAKAMGVEEVEAPVLANIGEIYLYLEQADSSKFYLDKASQIFAKTQADPANLFYLDMLYASLYLHNNQMKEAESLLTKSYEVTAQSPNHQYLNDKRLEEFYKKKGNFEKAYQYRKEADVYDDSLHNITIQNNIIEIDSRYRQDTIVLKRDIQIARQEQKVQQFKSAILVLISVLILLLASIIAFVTYMRRKREKEYTRQMALVTKLRMENVRNRVSPHFILNVLNTLIPGLEKTSDNHIPLQLLTQTIRESLLASEEIAIPLKEEISIVKSYIALRKNMDPQTPDIHWEIDPNMNMDTLLPSMMIQIPVENAIKYAFPVSQEENILSIKIAKATESLSVVIEDNGIGYLAASSHGTGQGLKIIYRTIELLNSKNHSKITFDIQDLSHASPALQGTKVTIKIPLHYKYSI